MTGLPVLAEDRRTEAKFRAPSSLQERLNAWLKTSEGEEWLESRRQLEAVPNHEECVVAEKECSFARRVFNVLTIRAGRDPT